MRTQPTVRRKSLLVCLDLEGTLISNAVSQIPRPHLFEFLHELKEFADVVLYTSVSEDRTKAIKALLANEKYVPEWFRELPSLHPIGTVKSRELVSNRHLYETILLVDDQAAVVKEGEADGFVHVKKFLTP